jgi:hypothetical protein
MKEEIKIKCLGQGNCHHCINYVYILQKEPCPLLKNSVDIQCKINNK